VASGQILKGAALNEELVRRFERWLVVQGYSEETQRFYIRAAAAFGRYMGKASLVDTTHFDVRDYLGYGARRGLIRFTLKHELHALRVFFDFMNMGGLMPWAPPRFVKIRTPIARVPRYLTEQQIQRVFDAARDARERAILELLYGSGVRPGELVSIRVEDVDFSARRILVHGKRGARYVLFGKSAGAALRKYLQGRASGFAFADGRPGQRLCTYPGSTGGWRCQWKVYDEAGRLVCRRRAFLGEKLKLTRAEALAKFKRLASPSDLSRKPGARQLSAAAIGSTLKHIGRRAGILLSAYKLRHSFATHMLDRGADVRVIQELLGHERLSSTQVYTHVSKANLSESFRRCHPRA
jgi:integrase/recombinase XerC